LEKQFCKNTKEIATRGWGPRALNYNALLHPEVLTSKPGYRNNGTELSTLNSNVTPEELNLSQGLAGTLVDKIFVHKAEEAELSGANAVDRVKKRKATAEENLKLHDKRVTAGLIAAAGKDRLSENIRDYVRERVQEKEHRECSRQVQKKDSYDALPAKVQAIKDLNLPPECWNQAQLKIMIRWYKRDGDDKLQTKKQEQLARYYATCNRGDLEAPPLPLLPLAHDNDSEDDADELPPPPLNPMSDRADLEPRPLLYLPTPDGSDCADLEPQPLLNLPSPDGSDRGQHSNNERELAILLANDFQDEQPFTAI